MKPISIDVFNTFLQGGAANGAMKLCHSLADAGMDARFIYKRNINNGKQIPAAYAHRYVEADFSQPNNLLQRVTFPLKARPYYRRIVAAKSGKPAGFEAFSQTFFYYQSQYKRLGRLPQVINLHWVNDWLDFGSFFGSIPNDLPIIWTLQDENPYTGGCHYTWQCPQYLTHCGLCPQLHPVNQERLCPENFDNKMRAFAGKNIHVVGISNWLSQNAQASALLKHARSYTTIPLGIDIEAFSAQDRVQARQALNLPQDRFIICSGADDLGNRRKGAQQLYEAWQFVKEAHPGSLLLLFGRGSLKEVFGSTDPDIIEIGHVGSVQQLAQVYSAANVFAITSLEEGLGQTVLEAMACQVPAVGFDTSGIRDSVVPGETGFLAPRGDAQAMAAYLLRLAQNPAEAEALGRNARQRMVRLFSLDYQINQYLQLINQVTQRA